MFFVERSENYGKLRCLCECRHAACTPRFQSYGCRTLWLCNFLDARSSYAIANAAASPNLVALSVRVVAA